MSIASKLARYAATAGRHPSYFVSYPRYRLSQWLHGGHAVTALAPQVSLSFFSTFGEYLAAREMLAPRERAFLQSYAFPPGHIIDIGANLGVVSLVLARRYPDRTIHAFEPNPSTLASLERNVALNGLANVRSYPMAMSNQEGTVLFEADARDRGTCRLARDAGKGISVEATTLDAFCERAGLPRIALLKVDVEGFEATVFAGARSLLKRQAIDVVYYEVCPANANAAGIPPSDATRILQESGYSIFSLDERGRPVQMSRPSTDAVALDNWVAIAS